MVRIESKVSKTSNTCYVLSFFTQRSLIHSYLTHTSNEENYTFIGAQRLLTCYVEEVSFERSCGQRLAWLTAKFSRGRCSYVVSSAGSSAGRERFNPVLIATAGTQKLASASCDCLAFPGRDKPKIMLQHGNPWGSAFQRWLSSFGGTVESLRGL